MRYAVRSTPGGTLARVALDVHVDRDAGRADVVDERGRDRRDRAPARTPAPSSVAQHAEHAADLGQRRAARRRDRFERLLRLCRVGRRSRARRRRPAPRSPPSSGRRRRAAPGRCGAARRRPHAAPLPRSRVSSDAARASSCVHVQRGGCASSTPKKYAAAKMRRRRAQGPPAVRVRARRRPTTANEPANDDAAPMARFGAVAVRADGVRRGTSSDCDCTLLRKSTEDEQEHATDDATSTASGQRRRTKSGRLAHERQRTASASGSRKPSFGVARRRTG